MDKMALRTVAECSVKNKIIPLTDLELTPEVAEH